MKNKLLIIILISFIALIFVILTVSKSKKPDVQHVVLISIDT